MQSYTNFSEIQENLFAHNVDDQLIALYCFVDEFIKLFSFHLLPYIQKPSRWIPPKKTFRIGLSSMVTLALFFPFSGQRNYFSYHRFIMTHYKKDFPHLPDYPGFVSSLNTVMPLCFVLAQSLTSLFRNNAGVNKKNFSSLLIQHG